ncbi:MAG: lysophospholipid acyltransferase family protein [Cellulosilyticaceae bacterium]
MIRSIKVLWTMAWHYVKRSSIRNKNYIGEAKLPAHEKKQKRTAVYKCMRELSNNMLKAADTQIIIKGKENLPKEGPVVYMGTHKSLFDSPLMAHLIDEPIIFIGKEETKKMPVISKWFDAMGCIYLDRDDMKKQLQSILQGIEELKEGQSIVIFPEGTRSKGREVGSFKAGSFKLATKANVPIVPIAFQDTFKILEETGRVEKATIYVNIGEPIDVPNLPKEKVKTLPQDVEQIIKDLIQEITVD